MSALDGTVFGRGTDLQVHHFFPRALLRKQGVPQSKIDTFANYVVIRRDTNLEAGTYEPSTYLPRFFRKMGRAAGRLRSQVDRQCIPGDVALWRVERYDDFLAARRDMLAEAANKSLGA
jgi:hypothetical protein